MTNALRRKRHNARRACRRKFPLTNALCQDCFYAAARERHHEDGDVTNNAPANVRLVCLECHDRIHTGERYAADREPGRWERADVRVTVTFTVSVVC